MQQRTHKVFYDAHTWLGILAGILLFIVTFSGFPAMFSHELSNWQSPVLNQLQPQQHIDFERLLNAAQVEDFGQDTFFISPETDQGYARLAHFNKTNKKLDLRYIELTDYQPIDIGTSEVAHLFEHLHTDLHLTQPFGRYLVGLAGMVMLLSIIAGIVIHTKWRKEFVMLRAKRSWRLLLTDQHKLIGLWTLPFSFILAFTGTILGLLGIISPILALAKFDGDVQKATVAVLGPSANIVGEAAPSVSINTLYLKAQKAQPDMETSFIQIDGYGDKGGVIKFGGQHKTALSNLQSVTYSLADGHLVHELNGVEKGPFQRIFSAVTPLHYVLFGDIALKMFYALSTLALCALIISGNMIWLEKKKQQSANNLHNKPHILARVTLGSCAGLILTCALTLAASQCLHAIDLGDIHQHEIEEGIFWAGWIIAILYALWGDNLRHKTQRYLTATSFCLLLTIIADGFINQRWLWGNNLITTGVHLTLLALALVCGYFARYLPQPRQRNR